MPLCDGCSRYSACVAENWDEARLIADGFERAYTELDWYDGPRAGIADVGGEPHYFERYDDYDDRPDEEYRVWPASNAALELEREQWRIFARWYGSHGAGRAGLEANPASGGVDARYDELESLLAPYRQAPDDTRRLAGEVRYDKAGPYAVEGPNFWFRWRPSG